MFEGKFCSALVWEYGYSFCCSTFLVFFLQFVNLRSLVYGKSQNQSFFTWIKRFYLKRLIFGILEFRFHLVAEFRRPAMKKSKRFQKSSCFKEQTPRTPYVFSRFPHHFSTWRMCSYSHQQDQRYSHFFLAASVWSYNRFGDVRAAMSRVLKATQVVHFVHDYGSIQPQTHATSGFDPNMNAKYKESSYIQTRHTWGSSHAHNELLTSQALYNELYKTIQSSHRWRRS